MKPIVIFGAGKIARGFINHLLAISGYSSVFVEKSKKLCELINERKEYEVNILGSPEKNMIISNTSAVCLDDVDKIAKYISETDLVFTAVGGKNLRDIVPVIAAGIRSRFQNGNTAPINVVTCENWKEPASILKNGVKQLLSKESSKLLEMRVGFSEAVVMRSAIEGDKDALDRDPLLVNVQDFWSLPVDRQRLIDSIPPIQYIDLMDDFSGYLERKLYTYNAANGTVAFVGSILGYTYISEACRDPFIVDLLQKVYAETTEGLCKKHGISIEEQKEFADSSLRKLRDEKIIDTLERNARDPIRKLSPNDRLVGAARLMMEYGVKPDGILTSIACALFYNGSDESAIKLRNMRKTKGIDHILTTVCGLGSERELMDMVKNRILELVKNDIIKEPIMFFPRV